MKNFLGIPVEGDITKSYRRSVPQRPVEELGPILQEALEAPGVQLRWRQYTPYFNDGDPCEFSVHDVTVNLPGVTDGIEGDYGDEGFAYPRSVEIAGGDEERYEYPKGFFKTGVTFPRSPYADALGAAGEAVNSGAFDDVLLETFGDHAVVTVTKDKIDVEYYEHD